MSPVLEVKGLRKLFPMGKKGILFTKPVYFIHAVDGVSFSVEEGETFGLAGEVGSGKTTVIIILSLPIAPSLSVTSSFIVEVPIS